MQWECLQPAPLNLCQRHKSVFPTSGENSETLYSVHVSMTSSYKSKKYGMYITVHFNARKIRFPDFTRSCLLTLTDFNISSHPIHAIRICLNKSSYPFLYPKCSHLNKHSTLHAKNREPQFWHTSICMDLTSLKPGPRYWPTILWILGIMLWLHSISGTKPSWFIQIAPIEKSKLICLNFSRWKEIKGPLQIIG